MKNNNKTYGVIYARFSPGPNQTDQSIEGQVRDCTEYAEKNGIHIIEIYADRHLTGTESEHRTEFQRMLRDAERKQFSVVVTWKIDRFGRNREEIAINKVHLKKYGVRVCYAKEHIPEGPEGIILESMLEGMAEYYSAELAQKIRRGQRESVLKGRIITPQVLFGYKKDSEMHYVIDESKAPIVREIFQLYSNGYMLKEICDILESKGIRNPRGHKFKYNMIHNMLRNRQYIGEYRYGDNVNLTAIPPIISRELFDAVQERIANSSPVVTAAKARAISKYLLSEKITCACCGYHYQGECGTGKHGERHFYYKCHGKKSHKTNCHSRNFKKKFLEDVVMMHTSNDVLTDDMINLIADRIIYIQENDSTGYAVRVLNSQLTECENKLKNVMKAIEAGIITSSTKNRLQELEQEKEALSLALTQEKNKRIPFSREHIIYWLELFRFGDTESEAFREKIVNTFINNIVVNEDTLIIAYNILNKERTVALDDIMQGVRMHDSEVDQTGVEPVSENPFTVLLQA